MCSLSVGESVCIIMDPSSFDSDCFPRLKVFSKMSHKIYIYILHSISIYFPRSLLLASLDGPPLGGRIP